MDYSRISEGDTVLLYCIEAKGYIYSQNSSIVTLFPAELSQWNNDPLFPNVHFACFQVLADNAVNISSSPLDLAKETFHRDLIYGCKIKLLHVASNKYLSLSSLNKKGQLNPPAKLIDKEKFNDDTCVFRILPAQPQKHRGEEILSKDKVKLSSVSRKEHNVLVAKNSLTDRYELKMAVTDSTFAIYCQTRASKINHKALRGCGVVMLFDMKLEAYLAGCASLEHIPDHIKQDNGINEVGARQRGSFHGIQKAPPFSGDCFWQLEKVQTPFLGDHLKVNEECRIKHLPSQQYLAVIPGEEGQQSLIALKKLKPGQPSDPQVTFSLISSEQTANINENEGIPKGSYIQLQHVNSVKNLTVQGSSFVPKALSDVKVDPSSESRWFNLGLESTDDSSLHYFRIDEVNVDLVHDYYYVSGVTTVLSEHLKKLQLTKEYKLIQSLIVPQELYNCLDYLCDWIPQKKNRANMLRIAQGVDILVAYLDLKIDQSLCRKISKILQCYIDCANKKSRFYLAHDRFLDILVHKVGHDIDIEKVLSSLVRDESAITGKILSNTEHEQHIMSKFAIPSTLDFLSTLCFTAGKPSRHLQLLILENIIMAKDIFVQTEINENGQLCFSSPEEIKGPVSKYCSKNAKVEGNFKFFIAQLKLFSGVCKGLNMRSIELFCKKWKFITFEEALICIKDPEIHPLLKSAYFDYIVSAYVDLNVEESGTDIDNIWHCYEWCEICPNPIKAMNLPDAKEMQELQKSIRQFLQKNKVLCAQGEVEGHNELMVQMFSVMEPLVSYGFYWKDEDVSEIIESMIYILDGETDKPEQNGSYQQNKLYTEKGRYDKNVTGNNEIFKIKIKAIRVLHFFLKQLCNMCMMKLIYDFKYMYHEISGEDVPDDYTPINDSLTVLLKEGYQLNDQLTQIIKLAHDRLQCLLDESAYECFDRTKQKGQDLIKILVDLMKYDNNELRISSALLLFDIFNEENLIFHEASISYLVTEPSNEVCGMMVTFGCFSKRSDKCLLHMIQGTAISDSPCRQAVWFLNHVGEHQPHSCTIGRLAEQFLIYVGGICTLDCDETQPHYCHQMIAVTSGVFKALVTYVIKYCGTDHEEQEELLNITCWALQRIIYKNDQAQRRIFDNFVDFLDVRIAISSVAHVLTETLCDNPDLCRNLSEGDIRQIYSLATTDTNLEYCDFCSTLQTIMKPYKSPYDEPLLLKKHQELIARMFNQRRKEYVNELMLTTCCQKRLTSLQNSQDDSIELLQLLNVSDMLSTCTEGQHKYAVNICQKIFTLEELVSIISDPVVPFERKKPFSRLLTRAYLNTERDSLVSISDLCSNDLFWTHMEQCSVLITSLTKTLHDIKKEEIKQKLRFLSSHHMSMTAWKKKSTNLNILLKSNEDDDRVSLNSFLFYLVDGIIPLLTTFCTQLRDHTSRLTTESYSSLLTSRVVSVLRSINIATTDLVQTHLAVFKTSKEQMHLWNVFFEMVNFILPVNVETTTNEFKRLTSNDYFVTSSLKHYEETWKNEQELNKQFQSFVTNFKITYQRRANQRMTDDIIDTAGCSILKRSAQNDLNLQQLYFLFPLYNPVHNINNTLPTGASFIAMVNWFAKDINYSGPLYEEMSRNSKIGNVSQLLTLVKIVYQRLQQAITSKERTDLDNLLQTTLQVISGVVLTKIDKVNVDPDLRKDKPQAFVKLYMETVEPLQKALVDAQSYEQVLLHLAHPKDEIALQVLGFIDVLLYQGNRDAQKKIEKSVTSSKDVAFFKRISKLLGSVFSSFGKSQPWKEIAKHSSHEAPPSMNRTDIVITESNYGLEDAGPYMTLDPTKEVVIWRSQPEMSLSTEDVDIGARKDLFNGPNVVDIPNGQNISNYAFGGYLRQQTVRPYEVEVAGQLETSKDEAKKRASVVLEVVASMCDGQNKEMQNLFRKQDQNFTNINLLVEIISLLQTLTDDLNEDIFQLIQKNIQALIEICAGNYSNQEIAFKGQVVDSVNIILRRNANFEFDRLTNVHVSADELLEIMLEETDNKSKGLAMGASKDLDVNTLKTTMKKLYSSYELAKVHISAIELLEVMLEETDSKSKELAVNISRDLDIDALMKTMRNLYDLYNVSGSTDAEKGMFKAFNVLQKIADYLGTTVNDYVMFKERYEGTEMNSVWNYVHEFSHSIEINYVNDKKEILTRVYFQYDPKEKLIEGEKQMLRKKVKRDSPENKVNDLMEWIFSIRKNKKHQRKINYKWYFQWSQVASQPRRWALIILTLLLNLFILILFKIPREQNRDINSTLIDNSNASFTVIIFPDVPLWFSYGLLYILGIVHFILAVWMVAEYFILEKPNILLPRFPEVLMKVFNFWNVSKCVLDKPYVRKTKKKCLEFYLLSFAPLYRICFVIFSLLALGTSGYFYCCCIFYIFLKWRTLELILIALRRSAIQLISVGLLGLAILFLYAVFSFIFLHNFYDRNADLYCNTLLECYFSVTRVGLLDTLGAISLTYVGQSGPSFTVFWTRTIVDVSFFIIMTTLGLNIVIAILVDRFSELRSESDSVEKDDKNYCFICGIDNDTFERHQQAKGFDYHIKNDHNMWNYVYFALHLDTIHHLDHNALEKYVDDKLKNRDNCFFPLRMAKVLGGRVSDNDYEDLIKNLKAELQK